MLEVNEIMMIRKMLGISSSVIAGEMETTRQTINNIENGKAQKMSIKFYIITVLDLINKCDSQKKEEVKNNLMKIIEYL